MGETIAHHGTPANPAPYVLRTGSVPCYSPLMSEAEQNLSDSERMSRAVETEGLARLVADGTRGEALRRFVDIAARYGYEQRVDGIVDTAFNDELLATSWIAFAGLVLDGTVKLPRDMNAVRVDWNRLVKGYEEAVAKGDLYTIPQETTVSEVPEITYFYTTRTETISLSTMTTLEVVYEEEMHAIAEGPCESQAALECDGKDPNPGFLRVLPESMLPGGKLQQMLQCIPCHEASVSAYVRKSHGK